MPVRIKICCISSVEEARLAVEAGADALGLVSAMPSGPGVIDDMLIAEIAAWVPPPVATFLLTSLQDADRIVDQVQQCRTSTVQLVDELKLQDYETLRRGLPGVKLVQVIHVTDVRSIRRAQEVAPHVDALLLDSGNPDLQTKELGGTGRRHDWSISRQIVSSVQRPVFLAGGLDAENVVEALLVVKPFGIDICSGVRTDGRLDETKLHAFFEALHRAM